jgi:uncharacterized protein (DUF427 family)
MSLMLGTGPFGQRPGGVFNSEPPEPRGLIWFEDSPRRIRAVFAGETVVDSRHAKLLHEHAHLPIYYFPEHEVRTDLLEPTAHSTRCPWKGEAAYWSVRVGDRVAENAVWGYDDPIEGAPPLAGYRALYWDAMDEWLEEEERIHVHARDPHKRVDVLASSRHVEVAVGDQVVADSRRPHLLFETHLPVRYYLPREDVRMDLLEPSEHVTRCPYKGRATYWSVRAGGELHESLAWTYEAPIPEQPKIRGLVAFFNERVDLRVDGEARERPLTPWSR